MSTVRLSLVEGFVLIPTKKDRWELIEVINTDYGLNGVNVRFVRSEKNKVISASTPTKKVTYDWLMNENKKSQKEVFKINNYMKNILKLLD